MTLQFDAVGDVRELIADRVAQDPDRAAHHYRASNGEWQSVSWRDYQNEILAVAQGLIAHGLEPGETAAIVAAQSYRWDVMEKAILACGAIVAGVDHLASLEQKRSYIDKLQPAVLVIGDERQLAGLDDSDLRNLKLLISLQDDFGASGLAWSALSRVNSGPVALPDVSPDAPATIVFTSGSSGEAKAVSFSQKQLILAAKSILQAIGSGDENDVTLCWLPLSNLFQRVMNLCAVTAGAQTYFAADPRRVMDDIAEIGPSVLIAVPRFYEKIAERAASAIAEQPALQRKLLHMAMAATSQEFEKLDGEPLPAAAKGPVLSLADHFLLRGLRRRIFGPRIRMLITGSASTPLPVKRFFAGIGLPLAEAYAMTENIVPMSFNRIAASGAGGVGCPLPENEIRIDRTGEILVRGPGLFAGYVGEEDGRQRFTEDGFFRTGDEGHLDEKGRLHLAGRKSDLIKTSTGRRIPPSPIEAELRAAPLVQDAVVVGNGRKCLTAVLALDQEAMEGSSPRELLHQLSRLVQQTNDSRASYERIAGCVVLRKGFSIDEGHLTTNLKPRRGRIEDAVARPLEQLYQAINDNELEEGAVQRIDDIAFAEAS